MIERVDERKTGETSGAAATLRPARGTIPCTSSTPSSHPGTEPRAGRTRDHGFRPDIEGLRAVALLLVLVYHAEVGWATGGYVGVDVFFVISGFLITGLLLREVERTGTIRLGAFYARRVRRLLPATVVVFAAVVLLAWLVLSPVDRSAVYADVVAAALYVINWRQATEAVAYSDLDAAASPLQHFWSLAVEEQFYLLWPLLVLGVALLARRGGRHLRRRLACALGALTVVSFGYAVHLTQERGDAAYFTTTTRGWELAAGGLLALVPTEYWRRAGTAAAWLLGLGGAAAIAVSLVGLTERTPFPGPWAALPVAGALAVIGAGAISRATPVGWLLSTRPMRYVGRISYSWYLWHWPLIVFASARMSGLPSTLLLVVVALSWLPAALTHRLVETPFRRARAFTGTGSALALGGGCTVVSVALGTTAQEAVPSVALAGWSQTGGAQVLATSTAPQASASALRPLPADAEADKGRADEDGCLAAQDDTAARPCFYGDTSSDTTVVLFGDSHAMQYFAALEPIAEERGWRLAVLTKSACTPADVTVHHGQFDRPYRECDDWRADALDRIEELRPAMVVTGNKAVATVVDDDRRLGEGASAEAMTEGYADTLRRLRDTGAEVAVVADNPYPTTDVPSCVSDHLDDLSACAFPSKEGLAYEPVNTQAARDVSGVTLIDPTPVLCPRDESCPAVIGNALVYRNGTHLTATYARTMSDWFDRRLPRLPDGP